MDNMEINPLEILYQDEYLVAINKPSGLLVHKSPIDKHETQFALQLVRDQIGQYVYPIHRLDKPTSGVLLFALSAEMAQTMSLLFRSSQVHKEYIAIVRGYTEDGSLIDYPLKQMLDTKEQKKQGISRYPVARYSLVRLFPKTGRKHQLRRHMKHIFHPIVGDTKHGRGEHNKLFREKYECHRLLLHSNQISFMHPINKEKLVINASLDHTWLRLFRDFGWEKIVY